MLIDWSVERILKWGDVAEPRREAVAPASGSMSRRVPDFIFPPGLMRLTPFLAIVLLCSLDAGAADVVVRPERVDLNSPEDSVQVLVETTSGGRLADRTREAKWSIADAAIARVDASGMVTPLANGQTQLVISLDGGERRIPVHVGGVIRPRPLSFQEDVNPTSCTLHTQDPYITQPSVLMLSCGNFTRRMMTFVSPIFIRELYGEPILHKPSRMNVLSTVSTTMETTVLY